MPARTNGPPVAESPLPGFVTGLAGNLLGRSLTFSPRKYPRVFLGTSRLLLRYYYLFCQTCNLPCSFRLYFCRRDPDCRRIPSSLLEINNFTNMASALRLSSSTLRASLRAPGFTARNTAFNVARCYSSSKSQVRRETHQSIA